MSSYVVARHRGDRRQVAVQFLRSPSLARTCNNPPCQKRLSVTRELAKRTNLEWCVESANYPGRCLSGKVPASLQLRVQYQNFLIDSIPPTREGKLHPDHILYCRVFVSWALFGCTTFAALVLTLLHDILVRSTPYSGVLFQCTASSS